MSTGEIAEKLNLGLNTFEYNLDPILSRLDEGFRANGVRDRKKRPARQLKYNSPCPCLQRCPQGISY
ncbi:hypothetical protein MSMAT_0216 [Methanosarcina mazei TMA]|nr:hypothetical protein MSMAT_0216 [Methanosarcina mazei TMA]